MKRLFRTLAVVSLALLAACESTGTHLLTYAAQGTLIQADRLVRQIFSGNPEPLPYGGPDIDGPLRRMHERFPELRGQLDLGLLGLTEDGDVAIREASGATPELKALVRAENRDRALLYTGMAAAVGHGRETMSQWLPYVDASFGAEWQKQAPAGWWLRDAQNEWQKK